MRAGDPNKNGWQKRIVLDEIWCLFEDNESNSSDDNLEENDCIISDDDGEIDERIPDLLLSDKDNSHQNTIEKNCVMVVVNQGRQVDARLYSTNIALITVSKRIKLAVKYNVIRKPKYSLSN